MAQIEIEPPAVELTGEEIVEDACCRLAAELMRSCHLSATSAYRRYSGKIILELQLEDFDTTGVSATVTVGNPDPGRPSQRFEVDIPVGEPSAVRERSELTVPSLDRFEKVQAPVEQKRRYYSPRQPKVRATK